MPTIHHLTLLGSTVTLFTGHLNWHLPITSSVQRTELVILQSSIVEVRDFSAVLCKSMQSSLLVLTALRRMEAEKL
jgi:hypothetical protein